MRVNPGLGSLGLEAWQGVARVGLLQVLPGVRRSNEAVPGQTCSLHSLGVRELEG